MKMVQRFLKLNKFSIIVFTFQMFLFRFSGRFSTLFCISFYFFVMIGGFFCFLFWTDKNGNKKRKQTIKEEFVSGFFPALFFYIFTCFLFLGFHQMDLSLGIHLTSICFMAIVVLIFSYFEIKKEKKKK